jgi:hypothetical protein
LVVLLVIVLLLAGGYVSGYLYLSEVGNKTSWVLDRLLPDGTRVEEIELSELTRVFPHPWHVTFFRPAATIEGWLRRVEVKTMDEKAWNIEIATDGM